MRRGRTLGAALVALGLAACAAPRPQERTQPPPSPTPAAAPRAAVAPATDFAAYTTGMHRRIHKLFTLGFLAYLDSNPMPAYADATLWTRLTIVVRDDGTIDRVELDRPSGVMGFDVAAIDAVQTAAPFDPPPAAILNADRRFQVEWQFHRDERACGRAGVEPHDLGNEPPPASEKALQ